MRGEESPLLQSTYPPLYRMYIVIRGVWLTAEARGAEPP